MMILWPFDSTASLDEYSTNNKYFAMYKREFLHTNKDHE